VEQTLKKLFFIRKKQNVHDRKYLIYWGRSKKGFNNQPNPRSNPAKIFFGLSWTSLLLVACPNSAPIERYDQFSMTMSDRPWVEKKSPKWCFGKVFLFRRINLFFDWNSLLFGQFEFKISQCIIFEQNYVPKFEDFSKICLQSKPSMIPLRPNCLILPYMFLSHFLMEMLVRLN
jgi:hypothetical protein